MIATTSLANTVLGTSFEPLKISPVPITDDKLKFPDLPVERPLYQQHRTQRMLGLALIALNDILPNCPNEPLPIFLAGPEATPSAIDGHFLQLLSLAAPSRIDALSSRLIATGRPAGLQALQLAFKYFAQTGAPYVLIGGVDSLIDLATMGIWDSEDRISSVNTTDGFVPGEGAAFILLSANASPHSLSSVGLPGVASEPGHRYSKEPYLGSGMADAFRLALQQYQGAPIETIFSGINGESFGTKEHGAAFTRNHRYLSPSFNVEHPADCFGGLGAAIGPALLGLAANGIRSGKIKGSVAVCCAADNETRAACTVTVIDTSGQ